MAQHSSLVIQSVLYGNAAADILRAAEATARSAELAVRSGLLSEWSISLGDCSPEPVFGEAELAEAQGIIAQRGGTVRYTVFGANLGSAAGHNALAALDGSELMLILNPDALVGPETVTRLIESLRDGVGIVEARQIPLEHPKDYAAYLGDSAWASTACALTRREAFDKVGGFDAETFFLYCDDVDYSWRLRLAGYRVVYEPAARVFHDKRLTVTGDWPASSAEIYYSAEAALFLAYKYSRDDVVTSIEQQFEADRDNEAVQRALGVFRSRRSSGQLPERLDANHTVAAFVGGNYAVHRF